VAPSVELMMQCEQSDTNNYSVMQHFGTLVAFNTVVH